MTDLATLGNRTFWDASNAVVDDGNVSFIAFTKWALADYQTVLGTLLSLGQRYDETEDFVDPVIIHRMLQAADRLMSSFPLTFHTDAITESGDGQFHVSITPDSSTIGQFNIDFSHPAVIGGSGKQVVIAIGTVTALSPGSTPYVTIESTAISDTTITYTLAFGLVTGNTGAMGPPGIGSGSVTWLDPINSDLHALIAPPSLSIDTSNGQLTFTQTSYQPKLIVANNPDPAASVPYLTLSTNNQVLTLNTALNATQLIVPPPTGITTAYDPACTLAVIAENAFKTNTSRIFSVISTGGVLVDIAIAIGAIAASVGVEVVTLGAGTPAVIALLSGAGSLVATYGSISFTDADYLLLREDMYCALVGTANWTDASTEAAHAAINANTHYSSPAVQRWFSLYLETIGTRGLANAAGFYQSYVDPSVHCDPCESITPPTLTGTWVAKFGSGRGWTPTVSGASFSPLTAANPDGTTTGWLIDGADHLTAQDSATQAIPHSATVWHQHVQLQMRTIFAADSKIDQYAIHVKGHVNPNIDGTLTATDGFLIVTQPPHTSDEHVTGDFEFWAVYDYVAIFGSGQGIGGTGPFNFTISADVQDYAANFDADSLQILEVWVSGEGTNILNA